MGNFQFVGENYGYVLVPLDNNWHMVTATYDGSFMREYVDGVLQTQAPASGLIKYYGTPLQIGHMQNYGEYFAGSIDDVRIYSKALTPNEVATLWKNGPS